MKPTKYAGLLGLALMSSVAFGSESVRIGIADYTLEVQIAAGTISTKQHDVSDLPSSHPSKMLLDSVSNNSTRYLAGASVERKPDTGEYELSITVPQKVIRDKTGMITDVVPRKCTALVTEIPAQTLRCEATPDSGFSAVSVTLKSVVFGRFVQD